MDAYNIYHLIKRLWAEHTNKHSGSIVKPNDCIKMCVWTPDGYKEVTNVVYNEKLKFIEIVLEET
jgi:hypothetical protein